MRTNAEKRLFWFLKEGAELDLSNRTHLDLYIKQTLSKGKTSDIKRLLRIVKLSDFVESFGRIKNFLPKEVKAFWEEWLGNLDRSPKKDTPEF
ncbi:MAG: hypothetical protein ACUVWO_14055 [Thermodesulfobacteriota bacterium]